MGDGYSRKRARTRRQLVRGAMAVIAERGTMHLTTSAVIEAAGVSRGTLYNYVEDSSQLRALVTDELTTVFELGQDAVRELSGDPAARIALGTLQLLDLARTDPVFGRAFLVALAADDDFRGRIWRIVGDEVRRGADRGQFAAPSPAATTDALVGAVSQSLRTALVEHEPPSPEEALDVCLRVLGLDDRRAVIDRAAALRVASAA